MREEYKLPDGESTADPDQYVDAWHEFAGHFCLATGTRMVSYDPGVAVGYKDRNGKWVTQEIPSWLIERFNLYGRHW